MLTNVAEPLETIMRRLSLLIPIMLATWVGILSVEPAFAADANLVTPEGAVAAYVDGIRQKDLNAIIAASASDSMGEGFNLVANVERLHVLAPMTPAPTSDPFFVEINKSALRAQVAVQVKFLVYSLMTKTEILEGRPVTMDAAGATEFMDAVRADRLTGLTLERVGIPKPALLNSEKHQANVLRMARVYGADMWTERVALLSFEGLHFVVGFTLLHYKDEWAVMSQSSLVYGNDSFGVAKQINPKDFEEILK